MYILAYIHTRTEKEREIEIEIEIDREIDRNTTDAFAALHAINNASGLPGLGFRV